MGFHYQEHFEPSIKDDLVLICKNCHTHICKKSLIKSDNFTGNSGPALLVDDIINFNINKVETKSMKTGDYVIKKVSCIQCSNYLGWKYLKSFNFNESYKENKFVIERKYLKYVKFIGDCYSLNRTNNTNNSSSFMDYNYSTSDDEYQINNDSLTEESEYDSELEKYN